MIKEVTMYTVICDNCKVDCNEESEWSCYNDKQYAEDVAIESDWHNDNEGHHYCHDCYSFDDNDDLVINEARKKDV